MMASPRCLRGPLPLRLQGEWRCPAPSLSQGPMHTRVPRCAPLCRHPIDPPLSVDDQERLLNEARIDVPHWVAACPHDRMRVAICAALISDMHAQLGPHSAVALHKAHLSREAFSAPFFGEAGLSTCGGSGRLRGWALNIGNTDGFEALTIRVMVDERQRPGLERCLLAAGAAAFVRYGPHLRPRHYQRWAFGRKERMYYIPHAILAAVAAVVTFCAGFGADSRGAGEVVDVSFEVFNGKGSFAVDISGDQHEALAAGGESRAATAHHCGDLLARAHANLAIGAIALFKSFFHGCLPSRTYVGVGIDYHVSDADGRRVLMMPVLDEPDAAGPTGARGSCAACAAGGVELLGEEEGEEEGEETEAALRPLGPHVMELGPEMRPVMFRDADDLAMSAENAVALGSLSADAAVAGARTRLPTGTAHDVEFYNSMAWHPAAGTRTATGPPCSAVHRRQAYLPTLAGHEKSMRSSARATVLAGDFRGSTRRTLDGVILLLGGLQAGAAEFPSDATSVVDDLVADSFLQRLETVYMLETPAGVWPRAGGTAVYGIGALVHCAVAAAYDTVHANGHAFSHEHLADAALLNAATLSAVSTAALQLLRGGPPSTADRVQLIACLADTTHVIHTFYDGNLGRDAKAAMQDRGACVLRRVGDLALREIDAGHVMAEAGPCRTVGVRSEHASSSTRARVAVLLARLDRLLQAGFHQRQQVMPSLEAEDFKRHVTLVLTRFVCAAPAGLARRDWGWVHDLCRRLAEDPACRPAYKAVGRVFVAALAEAFTGTPPPPGDGAVKLEAPRLLQVIV